jgi:hypothetical protein
LPLNKNADCLKKCLGADSRSAAGRPRSGRDRLGACIRKSSGRNWTYFLCVLLFTLRLCVKSNAQMRPSRKGAKKRPKAQRQTQPLSKEGPPRAFCRSDGNGSGTLFVLA